MVIDVWQLRAGSKPKELVKKKKAAKEDEDYEWPSSSDSSSGNIPISLGNIPISFGLWGVGTNKTTVKMITTPMIMVYFKTQVGTF